MANSAIYNNDRIVAGEVEYPANDPASGAFFQPDFKKNDDLKIMLDSSKDSLKLEAMKRIIGMIAKGRDASDLFAAVVKNVVSKNIEVKKLVYLYLVRYAEEQQDLALLSISTFQRALKDPNQLIRASALRVLSSIRVGVIAPIVLLAVRDSAADMSPYVRKTAAHAIPKLYSLDPEQKEELVSIIDKLLSDKAPLVVGSAAMAFGEVCGDRITLIHKSYRKLCSLLADVDEWGQLALLNVLTVYARTCFPDPNKRASTNGGNVDKESSGSDTDSSRSSREDCSVDPDLKLLLRAAKPLLQSRNSGVVMAVVQLFHHCGPAQEMPPIAKAMVRLLRSPPEVQSVVLNAIACLTVDKKDLFEPFLKSFFVRMSDPGHIKLLKLEVLTNLATEANAPVVLRELQTYVASGDSALARATIQAIGRLAVSIRTETETCLNGLLQLLSSKDEGLVCEAVVVVKRVVGGAEVCARAAVSRAQKLLRADRVAGNARAAAVWLVAEHGADQPRAAAVLAHMAETFADQEELVKLQVLSLAIKVWVHQPDTAPVCRYILALAKYDESYDVRDRARLLKRFVDPEPGKKLPQYARQIFCCEKPKPTVRSQFMDRHKYTLGSLSQYIGSAAAGYAPLPPAPRAAVGSHLRDSNPAPVAPSPNHRTMKNKTFYSEPESSSNEGSSSSEESESSDGEGSSDHNKKSLSKTNNYGSSESSSSNAEGDTESSESDQSDSDDESKSSSEDENTTKNDKKQPKRRSEDGKQSQSTEKSTQKSNLELLLELDEVANALPTMTPTCGGLLSPQPAPTPVADDGIIEVGPPLVPPAWAELVPRALWGGVQALRQWARAPHLHSRRMCAVRLTFTNHTTKDVTDIRIKDTASGPRNIAPFPPIASLAPSASATATLGVDFADSIQPVNFALACSTGEVTAKITPSAGELVRAVSMSPATWQRESAKLRGMNECSKDCLLLDSDEENCAKVFQTVNVALISPPGEWLRFSGRTISGQELVLIGVRREDGRSRVTAHCANMAIASLLANEIALSFQS